jgi:hypothetical protein
MNDEAKTKTMDITEASIRRGERLVQSSLSEDFKASGEPGNVPAFLEGMLRQIMQVAYDIAPSAESADALIDMARQNTTKTQGA